MIKEWNGININYEDGRFIDEVLNKGEYQFLFHYPVVIDIGCNIGTFSLFMLNFSDRIYAIEPAKENIDCLAQTIKDNNLSEIIYPFQLAISGTGGVKDMLRLGEASGGGWKLDVVGDYHVNTKTLLDFMNNNNIPYADLVKMDVEGSELEIVFSEGFPSDRVGTIIGEFHGDHTETREAFIGRLEDLGYRYKEVPGNHFIARKL